MKIFECAHFTFQVVTYHHLTAFLKTPQCRASDLSIYLSVDIDLQALGLHAADPAILTILHSQSATNSAL